MDCHNPQAMKNIRSITHNNRSSAISPIPHDTPPWLVEELKYYIISEIYSAPITKRT